MSAMQELRVHDPDRRPSNWTEFIGPRQFVAFAKDVENGVPCDAGGRPFADPARTTCLLFDSLEEARAFCEGAALAAPLVRFDVFDVQGRANPALLTFVHPSHAQSLDTSARALHKRRAIAWVLIAAGVPPIVYAFMREADIESIFPGVIGINLIVAGGRLLWLNLGIRETEHARQERVKQLER
jgi:hypothetical protein